MLKVLFYYFSSLENITFVNFFLPKQAMQNNYYFLKKLVPTVATKIQGLKLVEAFSQDKDELVLCFAAARGKISHYKEFYIKAVVYPKFSCLHFGDSFKRAKKNTVSLLEEVYDATAVGVEQYENERCFAIHFDSGHSLLFKLFGSRSNLILFKENKPLFLFNKKLAADSTLSLSEFNRKIDQSYVAFEQASGDYQKLFPTFGKLVKHYLTNRKIASENSLEGKWNVIQETLTLLHNPHYYIVRVDGELALSLVPVGELIAKFADPIAASNELFIRHGQDGRLEELRLAISRKLTKEKKQTESYLKSAYTQLEKLEEGTSNEQKGHLLMANLHAVTPRMEQVTLENFYQDNQPIQIKLKPELSAQKNAEWYYRKAKNEKIEWSKLTENIELRENKLMEIEHHQNTITDLTSLKTLRDYIKSNNLSTEVSVQAATLPYSRQFVEGYEIWIGKNAKSNDKLLQQYSYKEDLWMHVRDAPGSHVLLKYQAGKSFPKHIIELAAGVAAYNSKRKTEGLAPVIVTPKKYVRKAKGLAAGQVIIEKEEVILVAPANIKFPIEIDKAIE